MTADRGKQRGTPRQDRLGAFLDRVWSQGDVDACDEFLAASYTIEHDPGDPWEGRTLDLQGFKERLVLSRAPFPDQRFDVQALFENEEGVAATWLWSATHLGDLGDFPATGRTVTMSGATVYRFDEADRIAGHWQVTDRLGVYRQLQQGS